MPATQLNLKEEDVIKVALEFLYNRDLHISQVALERETGIINGNHSDDILFLRQLIIDGQWDDCLEFIQPLQVLEAFNVSKVKFLLLRQKYVELLCVRSEAGENVVKGTVDEVVKVLDQLETCATKEEHSNLCLLLTLPRLNDHLAFKDWNPAKSRMKCFSEVYPLIENFLPADKKGTSEVKYSRSDRLMQIIIKGLLYESCVSYCRAKATGSKESQSIDINLTHLLDGSGFSDSDLSLLSWLQSIPAETFSVPFEQRTLNVDVERLERPSLETSWTEHMLVRPIKPKMFPHSAISFSRPRSAADLMTRSLMHVPAAPAPQDLIAAMALSTGNISSITGTEPGFHLSCDKNKLMITSVDRLFKNDEVFISSSFMESKHLPQILENTPSSGGLTPDKVAPPIPPIMRENVLTNINESPLEKVLKNMKVTESIESHNNKNSNGGNILYREFQSRKSSMGSSIDVILNDKVPISPPLSSATPTDQWTNNSIQPNSHVNNFAPPGNINSQIRINKTPENNIISNDYDQVQPVGKAGDVNDSAARPRFVAVTALEDVQAVRCAEFHPAGNLYAVGSNSKTLRICAYPDTSHLREDHKTYQPTVVFKRTKHHKGSLYCLAWSPAGDLLATGSNDKTVKLMRFNADTTNLEGQEVELTMHDGTIRDLCFIEDTSNQSSLLISAGAGDCKIYVTDCATGNPFQALSGHSGHVLSLYNWGGALFVSGSQDRSVRFWDLRTGGCINVVTPVTTPGTRGSPVSSVSVEPSGRLLVSGHEDATCCLYDVRGGRTIKSFQPHTQDVRSVRFSPAAYYLLTAGYDSKLVLTDLQGDLTASLPSVVVATHTDKVISGRWHPRDFTFLSTSADKTSVLWALPPA